MQFDGYLSRRSRIGVRRGVPTRKLQLDANLQPGPSGDEFTVLALSPTGLLMRTSASLDRGEALEVRHPEILPLTARVIWTSEEHHVCEFQRRITPDELSLIKLNGSQASEKPERANADGFGFGEKTLGQRIRRLRKARRFTLVHFASVLGVSKPTLLRWETDTVLPRRKTLIRIATSLGVSEMELLYGLIDQAKQWQPSENSSEMTSEEN